MNNKRFAMVLDTGKCIDCKACTVACKAENQVPLGQENHRNWVTEEPLRGKFPLLGQSYTPGNVCTVATPPASGSARPVPPAKIRTASSPSRSTSASAVNTA